MGILLGALILGAWGQTLAAAMCPHMQQDHACCHASKVAHDLESHELKGEMHLMHAVHSTQSVGGITSDQPVEECDHCMGRSSKPPLTGALREIDATDQGAGHAAPAAVSRSSNLIPSFTSLVPLREHSPPKASADRHALLKVFRI